MTERNIKIENQKIKNQEYLLYIMNIFLIELNDNLYSLDIIFYKGLM